MVDQGGCGNYGFFIGLLSSGKLSSPSHKSGPASPETVNP